MVLLVTFILAGLASSKCFEPTTAHPPPDYNVHDGILQHTFDYIATRLQHVVAGSEYNSTSFSIEVTSSKESLWSLHHTARERNSSRPDIPDVNGDALYRIASITKTFTVLGILYQHDAGNLSLDHTVNQYLTELGEKSDGGIPWKDITLRSLASQLSGIPREFAQGDFINVPSLPAELGLPPVSRKGLPTCDEYSPNFETPCTTKDLLHLVKPKKPLYAPNQKSTYSNLAYEILGLVLERVTNQTFEAYITDAIFNPLNLSTSTLSLPPDSAGVIPVNPHYWDVDEGVQNPTGGIYSSSSDLSKYLRYILQHFNAITHAINWLHPVSPARGLHSFYGMPWEIFQTDRILKESRRTVQFVTKGGGLPGYTSVIMTVPEYDLGITILVAGPPALFPKINEIVTVGVVRAAEELAIRQLARRYEGTYASSDASLNSTVTLVADHRGLVITELISNSTDVLKSPIIQSIAPEHWYGALSPTLLFHDAKKQKGEEWRILIAAEREDDEGGIWDDFCPENIDSTVYAGLPFNELVFWDKDKDGRFQTLALTGFRVNLTRTGKQDQGQEGFEQEQLEL